MFTSRGDLQFSLSISLTQQYENLLHPKKGQYFKDDIFLRFLKPYGRQVFPHEEVAVLLLTRRVCFPVVFW